MDLSARSGGGRLESIFPMPLNCCLDIEAIHTTLGQRRRRENGMIQIILAIVGIFFLIRRSRVKALSSAQFPDAPPEKVMEWQALELRSTNLFLWTSAGLFLFTTLAGIILGALDAGSVVWFVVLLPTIVVFFICVHRSDVLARKADRIERLYRIRRPR